MSQLKLTVLVFTALMSIAGMSAEQLHAGPIVFSARYYYPPGFKKTSHSHIYTIDPSGKHLRELTRGKGEDESPQWSPDGKLIAFIRKSDYSDTGSLMTIHADGTQSKILAPIGSYSEYQWSKDSNFIEIPSESPSDETGQSANIVRVNSKNSPNHATVFVDKDDFISATKYDEQSAQNVFVSTQSSTIIEVSNVSSSNTMTVNRLRRDGTDITNTRLNLSKSAVDNLVDHGDEVFPAFDGITEDPNTSTKFYLWQRRRIGTPETDFGLFQANLATKTLTFITCTYFARWSPDQTEFVGSPNREITPHSRRADGTHRMVWTTGLFVYDMKHRIKRTIQSGLVLVEGADWKR